MQAFRWINSWTYNFENPSGTHMGILQLVLGQQQLRPTSSAEEEDETRGCCCVNDCRISQTSDGNVNKTIYMSQICKIYEKYLIIPSAKGTIFLTSPNIYPDQIQIQKTLYVNISLRPSKNEWMMKKRGGAGGKVDKTSNVCKVAPAVSLNRKLFAEHLH